MTSLARTGRFMGRRSSALSPLAIFGSRLKFWADPSDVSSMWQDSTMNTTRVAALNDPIGGIGDKSLGGKHAKQATSASRPLWKQDGNGCFYASFDGTDDSWATAAIDLRASDKVTIFTAARKRSDAARGIMYEFSADINSNNGSFTLEAPDAGAANTLRPRSKGTAIATVSVGSQVAPIGVVLAHVCDIAGDLTALYINGVLAGSSPTDQGLGNFGNYAHYIGRRGGASLPAAVDIYQHAIVQGIASAAEIAAMTAFLNSKSRLF